MRRLAAVLALVAVAATACGSHHDATPGRSLLVVVNAPFSETPYLGNTIENGVRLAAAQVNATGIRVGNDEYHLTVQTMDDALSPARAVANVRRAVTEGAVAIVDDGTGVDASWRVAETRGVPICIVFDGGSSLVDPRTRPNVFRIAPTDHGIAFRLAEYLVPKGLRLAILHDDSDYGQNGWSELQRAFSQNRSSVAIEEAVPADALDLSPQVLRARRAGATIASAIAAARSAGWEAPVYTPPTGADPFVRQQLADHPSWVDGLTFAAGRLTAEVGARPFLAFAQSYQRSFGFDDVGVKTREGKEVVQPPETAMYAYDFTNLLAAALARAASTDPAKVTKALEQVTVESANGDERSFNRVSHDGVVDDDVYFARFHDMTYAPVKDDPLSATLPTLPQTR
jgi:ABC-type branched-subunit amino acid transport system substrate-binding protein